MANKAQAKSHLDIHLLASGTRPSQHAGIQSAFLCAWLSFAFAYGMTGGDGQMVPRSSDTGGAVALRGSRLRIAALVAGAAATTAFIGAATSSPPRCSLFKTRPAFLASQQQQSFS